MLCWKLSTMLLSIRMLCRLERMLKNVKIPTPFFEINNHEMESADIWLAVSTVTACIRMSNKVRSILYPHLYTRTSNHALLI